MTDTRKETMRGNTNRLGKTKPAAEKKSAVVAIPVTSAEKGLVVAAAGGEKLADVYRPVLLRHAARRMKAHGLRE